MRETPGWPQSLLLDLAAARDPGPIDLDSGVIDVAIDHRMTGLLHTHLQSRNAGLLELAMYDLRIQAHQQRIHQLLARCLGVADELAIEVAVLKGVPIERRFYGRSGERPSSDVDLWLPPDDPVAVRALVARLQPDHPWLPGLEQMISGHRVQSVTLRVDGLEVDVHVDPLKLGIWTRQATEAWRSCQVVELGDGRQVRTLDDDWTLLLLLVHLTKDRFQRLLGYADVVRVARESEVSWERLEELARGEGIEDLISWALAAIERDLAVQLRPLHGDQAGGRRLRSRIWTRLWGADIRLRGSEGRRRFRFRQNLLPLLARGRTLETLTWWVRELFPPRVAVAAAYPDVPGPYLRRLAVGRVRALQSRHAAAPERAPRRPFDDPQPTPTDSRPGDLGDRLRIVVPLGDRTARDARHRDRPGGRADACRCDGGLR